MLREIHSPEQITVELVNKLIREIAQNKIVSIANGQLVRGTDGTHIAVAPPMKPSVIISDTEPDAADWQRGQFWLDTARGGGTPSVDALLWVKTNDSTTQNMYALCTTTVLRAAYPDPEDWPVSLTVINASTQYGEEKKQAARLKTYGSTTNNDDAVALTVWDWDLP